MNLGFVEAFYWAATLKSVSRAAKKLFITQSATSARIAVLEQELGVALLDRRDRHFALTLAGQRFLRDAERLLDLWRTIRADLGSSAERPTSLRIGAIESVLHSWLIPWLERMKVERSSLQLELTVETTPVLTELARRGSVDLVIASLPAASESLRTRALSPMPMVFVGKRSVHKRRRYTLAALADHDLLTFQRGSQPHASLLEMLRRAGLGAARVHAVSSISAMVRLTASGFGVATLPRAAIAPLLEGSELRVLPCDEELVPLPLHASWRLDPSSRVIDAVVEDAMRFAAEAAPRTARRKKSMS